MLVMIRWCMVLDIVKNKMFQQDEKNQKNWENRNNFKKCLTQEKNQVQYIDAKAESDFAPSKCNETYGYDMND